MIALITCKIDKNNYWALCQVSHPHYAEQNVLGAAAMACPWHWAMRTAFWTKQETIRLALPRRLFRTRSEARSNSPLRNGSFGDDSIAGSIKMATVKRFWLEPDWQVYSHYHSWRIIRHCVGSSSIRCSRSGLNARLEVSIVEQVSGLGILSPLATAPNRQTRSQRRPRM
jgi:hypothetical protein